MTLRNTEVLSVTLAKASNAYVMSGWSSHWDSIYSELASYSEEGWDGDGASAVSVAAVEEAYTFVCGLPAGTLRPAISVGYDGSIGFSWYQTELTMFVHIPPKGMLDFTFDLTRHQFRYSKRLSANAVDLLDELRPALSYIVPAPMVFVLGVTGRSFSVFNVEVSDVDRAGHDLMVAPKMLNVGR